MSDKPVNLNADETKVLKVLAADRHDDFGYRAFKFLQRRTRMNRARVRRACRSLSRKGLAEYGRGLWNEDGEPGGSGYAATSAGVERAGPIERRERWAGFIL